MATRSLHRRLTHLEHTLETTVSREELHDHLAHIAAIALRHLDGEDGEAFLDEIVAGAHPHTQLEFIDRIHAHATRDLHNLAKAT